MKKKETPVIGYNLKIGISATIIECINIGDDVVIDPNTFVNEDVLNCSIVIGNPAKIIHKDDFSKNHVCFRV